MSQQTTRIAAEPYPAFPVELKELPRWVTWQLKERGGRKTKVLYDPRSGKPAKTTDPEDWVDYETAVEHAPDYSGLGCVIGPPYVAIDLDKCRDPQTGVTEEWARQIIDEVDSYTELSPSDKGYHIWVKGNLPEGRRRAGRVEMYDRARYFTVTGNRLDSVSASIKERDLTSLHSRLTELDPEYAKASEPSPAQEALPPHPQPAAGGTTDSKFKLLMAGDWKQAGYHSHSEADMALCVLLASRSGCDPNKIDAEFRKSGLMRKKWNREDYRRQTIEKAIQRVRKKPTLEPGAKAVNDPIFRIPAAYPATVWNGTDYAKFADVCTRDNYIPREFPIEALKTVVGAAAGHLIGIEGDDNEARFYTVLIGGAGKGKSTSIKYATKALPESLAYTGGDPIWPELGCFMASFGSQVGLIRKSRTHHQILQLSDELSVLADKFRIHGSGISFLALINQLYEKTLPPSNVTKESGPEIERPVHFSLLGATTPDVWESTFGGTGSEGSGFFQRLNIIGSDEQRTVPLLADIDFSQFGPLIEKIKGLKEHPYRLPIDAEVRQLLKEWHHWLEEQKDADTGRLSVLTIRNAAHIGWLLGVRRGAVSKATPGEVIRRAIVLSNYQLSMRRKYRPLKGDSVWALMENLIAKHMQDERSLSRKELYHKVNGSRYGLKVFNAALLLLEREGYIRIEKVKTTRRPAEIIIWTGDETD